MCRVLNVSSSGYYGWLKRPLSKRKQQDAYLLKEIKRVHYESKENYGTLKIHKRLNLDGIKCGKNRIARLRKENNIETKRRKRFKVTTKSKNNSWIAPNILNRSFKSKKPNQVWVGDVTYIPTQAGWLYLSVLLDLYSRKVIGWSMSERNNKELVLKALEMALQSRKPDSKGIHHSDRGSIYGSDEYRERLKIAGFRSSMSRKGDCYDNAVAESFFSTLKNELIYGQKFKNRDHARTEIFKYIEIFYNRQRLHQTLGYITPEMAETGVSTN